MSDAKSPDRWQQVSGICADALARVAAERPAFLDAACGGDTALRREVESLLAQVPATNGFLDSAARNVAVKMMTDEHGTFTGRQIGIYKVTSLLGAGGMGEVYRARDTKLGRDVAIKVLPPMFTTDRDRLARFEREARMLATLNHPHIGAIYGLEDAEGIRALVLELVEGPTLAERLAHGPIPLKEALAIARQIAEALDAAHENGIIHRDLKPANIKITPNGNVKVLDFGLAKAATGDGSGADLSQSPTITVGGTHDGVILGTAAYMSPEQARGKPVDKRTDIWAFGCVFFEILTGQPAFPGETITDTLAAVLERDPDWSALAAQIPAGIMRLLQRCFEKDPKRRLRDVGEATIAIGDALTGPWLPAQQLKSHSAATRHRAVAWVLITIALAAVGGGLVAWKWRPAQTVARQFPVRLALSLGAGNQLALEAPAQNVLAISPDGKSVAYVVARLSGFALYTRMLSSPDATLVAEGRAPIFHPFFSPDSQWLAFSSNGKLRKAPVSGGQPVPIADASNFRGGSWGADGFIVYAPVSRGGLMRVSSEGGTPEAVTTVDASRGETSHRLPWAVPGSNALLYVVERPGGKAEDAIWGTHLSSGPARLLVANATSPQYVPTGHLLYVQADTLMAVGFDPEQLRLTGTPVAVIRGVGRFAASQTGSLLYGPGPDTTPLRTLVWVDRNGQETPLQAPPGGYGEVRLSPNGRQILLQLWQPQRQQNVLGVYDIARDVLSPFTFDGNRSGSWAIWSYDGLQVTYASISAGNSYDIFSRPADGTGVEEPLVQRPLSQRPYSWSSDGRLAFTEEDPAGTHIWILSTNDRKSHPIAQPSSLGGVMSFSPDGRWLAYESRDSGRSEIYLRPASGEPGQWPISSGGGSAPLWATSGREIFFRSGDQLFGVDVTFEPTLAVGKPHVLFEGPYLSEAGVWDYDVARNGQRFLMVKPTPQASGVAGVTVIQDWFDELTRLTAAK